MRCHCRSLTRRSRLSPRLSLSDSSETIATVSVAAVCQENNEKTLARCAARKLRRRLGFISDAPRLGLCLLFFLECCD